VGWEFALAGHRFVTVGVMNVTRTQCDRGRRRRLHQVVAGTLAVGVLATVTAVTTPPTDAATRRSSAWPFAVSSPWNRPIGTGARFESRNAARTANLLSASARPWVNAGRYSVPVWLAGSGSPLVTVRDAGSRRTHQLRAPAAARPAAGSDGHLTVVQPGGAAALELWRVNRQGTTSWTSGYAVRTDLRGSGFDGGVRASGASLLGGLIRAAELEAGVIRHALALAVPGGQLRQGPVWPATRQDNNAAGSYAGLNPMGTFVAIPPHVNVAALGLSPAGLAAARALQQYGAYVVDRAGAFTLFAQPMLEGTARLAALRRDMTKLREQLRVVVNNGPGPVAGGGTALAPFAPPLSG
jgi:hypothetical protein